ncbi:hypothetical protein GBAR_LOCUS24880, partial [Geodia barretti]
MCTTSLSPSPMTLALLWTVKVLIVMAVLVVSEQFSLMLNTQLLFVVTVRRNRLCPETKSPVLVTFGTRAVTGGECEIQQKATEMTISSGDSASFYVDAASMSLGPDETICFIVSLDGLPGIYVAQ